MFTRIPESAPKEKKADRDKILLLMEAEHSRASQMREECLERDSQKVA